VFTSTLWSRAVDNYYEYLRTFSQELGARIVEMYPPLQEPNDPLPTALETLLRQPLDHRSLDRRQLFGLFGVYRMVTSVSPGVVST
jgi:hypothetical protein